MATKDSLLDQFPKEFQQAMIFVALWEGGYVNHPNDPGGATNKGVTQGTYNTYRKNNKLPIQSVKLITGVEVYDIYYKSYWLASGCHHLPLPINVIVFDRAVNMGTGQSIKMLQKCLNYFGKGLVVDGGFGAKTIAAVKSLQPETIIAVTKLLIRESKTYREYIITRNSRLAVFRKGWANRDDSLLVYAYDLLGLDPKEHLA